MSSAALEVRSAQLRADRVPFVHARVVVAERPTSAKPGDEAIVFADGRIEGFVGGTCAESTVRLHSLALLDDRLSNSRQPLLLRISPESNTSTVARPGTMTVYNPCLSGGSLEIFLDPILPSPLMLVLANGPIADALARVGRAMDMQVEIVEQAEAEEQLASASAVVVASHGRDEPPVLTAALRAGVPYVGLVASRKRGQGVLAELDVTAEQLARVHTPAGLDIGARTPSEIAVSILAEIVSLRSRTTAPVDCVVPAEPPMPTTAIDPVCGMTVAAVPSTVHLEFDGGTVYFCREGCRDAFSMAPARFVIR